MVDGLDHVGISIPIGQEECARGFYGTILDLAEIEKPDSIRARGGVWYQLPDGRQLHLLADAHFTPAPRSHPAFIADLDQLALRTDPDWNEELAPRRRFYLIDPFGNRLEFLEPI